MKRTATGLLLLFFSVFTLRIGVERTQVALDNWSSTVNSHRPVFQSPSPTPKFSRIAESVFVQEEPGHSATPMFMAARIPAICVERRHSATLGYSLPRSPPTNSQLS
jgi:hypothetical protein